MNKSVTANRLNRLADFLTTLPSKSFKMDDWASCDLAKLGKKKAIKCGSVGCAFGWSCSIPSFRKAGLTLKDIGMGYFQPVNKHKYNSSVFVTAADFFGITSTEAFNLFHPDSYKRPNKHNVIRRLRSVAKLYG